MGVPPAPRGGSPRSVPTPSSPPGGLPARFPDRSAVVRHGPCPNEPARRKHFRAEAGNVPGVWAGTWWARNHPSRTCTRGGVPSGGVLAARPVTELPTEGPGGVLAACPVTRPPAKGSVEPTRAQAPSVAPPLRSGPSGASSELQLVESEALPSGHAGPEAWPNRHGRHTPRGGPK